MDWTKAKNILIVALLITNIVLVFTYVFANKSLESENEEFTKDTIKLLASKNIFIETEIPGQVSRMPVLIVEYDKMDQELVNRQIKSEKKLSDEDLSDESLIEETTRFIRKCQLLTENVTFESIQRKDDKINVKYKNHIEGIAIEESYINITVEDRKITKLERYWLKPVEFRKMKRDIIPSVAALIKFMSENEFNKKIYVEDIELVYWIDSSVIDTESPVTDTAFPAWKITYNRGQVEYVIAFEQ